MRPFFIVTKFYVPTVRGTVGYKDFSLFPPHIKANRPVKMCRWHKLNFSTSQVIFPSVLTEEMVQGGISKRRKSERERDEMTIWLGKKNKSNVSKVRQLG